MQSYQTAACNHESTCRTAKVKTGGIAMQRIAATFNDLVRDVLIRPFGKFGCATVSAERAV